MNACDHPPVGVGADVTDVEMEELNRRRKELPERVPLSTVGERHTLLLQQKAIIDRIKITVTTLRRCCAATGRSLPQPARHPRSASCLLPALWAIAGYPARRSDHPRPARRPHLQAGPAWVLRRSQQTRSVLPGHRSAPALRRRRAPRRSGGLTSDVQTSELNARPSRCRRRGGGEPALAALVAGLRDAANVTESETRRRFRGQIPPQCPTSSSAQGSLEALALERP